MPATHHPVATHLAQRLCLTGSSTLLGPIDAPRFAEEMIKTYRQILEDGSDEIVMASFSARFLPALVEAYKSVPDVITPYATMLRMLLDSGYFAKLMRGALGRDLYRIHGERIAGLDFAVDVKNVEGMESSIVMLVFLMVYSDHYHRNVEPLGEATKSKLIAVLAAIQDIYEGELMKIDVPPGTMPNLRARKLEECPRVSCIERRKHHSGEFFLRGQLTSDKMLGAVGQMMPWVTCGGYGTGCWQKGKQNGRLGCGRCETQTYCSKEHQKANWPQHKHSCFETVY
ncbi:hypothetical protein C8F04DRAFT_1077006 [Mycena alexandri]|uniref:MYND-type domain-containing protein n=1 Tax=Mycena alexandri TaxID=1745969 RepID=A0AAD6TD81_9AGAR|nr:hypothetical protein C8F04DRAFT_1077006 [Mycena alexandri]